MFSQGLTVLSMYNKDEMKSVLQNTHDRTQTDNGFSEAPRAPIRFHNSQPEGLTTVDRGALQTMPDIHKTGF